MNFLIVYCKNGTKVYYNIDVIYEFLVADDGSLIIKFKDRDSIEYCRDCDDNYDKWELI